jgi:hypothetical protein
MLILIPGANCDWPATMVGSFGMRIQTRRAIGSGGEFRPAHAWIGLIVALHAMNWVDRNSACNKSTIVLEGSRETAGWDCNRDEIFSGAFNEEEIKTVGFRVAA